MCVKEHFNPHLQGQPVWAPSMLKLHVCSWQHIASWFEATNLRHPSEFAEFSTVV